MVVQQSAGRFRLLEFFRHSRALAALCLIEFLERLSFFGMRSIMVLFMVAPVARGGMGLPDSDAVAIYGLYLASAYLTSLAGGWVADRWLGPRHALFLGAICSAVGHGVLATSSAAFTADMPTTSPQTWLLGLTLVALGTGMFKPNILALVGRLYGRSDYKRDEAFSLFYMSVNAGALGGGLLCGWTALKWGWHAGFLAASLGIGTCAVLLIALRTLVPQDDARPQPALTRRLWQLAGACGLIVLVSLLIAAAAGGASMTVDAAWLAKWATAGIAIIAATYFVYMLTIGAANAEERHGVSAVLVLFLCGTIFIFGFEQAGSWLTLFADRLTRRTIGDFEIPAAWFTVANAVFVVLFAPLLAVFWSSREALGHAFSIAQKLAIGLLLVSCGFLVVAYASTLAGPLAKVAPMWLIATYALHTLGELCISPVSLSAISRVAPARLVSQLMGAWYMSAALGSVASGALTNLISFEDAELSSRFLFTAFVIATGGLLLLSAARRLRALSL